MRSHKNRTVYVNIHKNPTPRMQFVKFTHLILTNSPRNGAIQHQCNMLLPERLADMEISVITKRIPCKTNLARRYRSSRENSTSALGEARENKILQLLQAPTSMLSLCHLQCMRRKTPLRTTHRKVNRVKITLTTILMGSLLLWQIYWLLVCN